MKVGEGTRPLHGGPLETITLLAHTDSEEEEEELVTITAVATPVQQQCQGRVVVETLPSILVTDITSASTCGEGTSPCLSGVSISNTQDSDPQLPNHSTSATATTTTTATTTATTITTSTTTQCSAVRQLGKHPAPQRRAQPRGTTHPNTRRKAAPDPPRIAKRTGGVLGGTQRSGHRVTDAPSASCGAKTTSTTSVPLPAAHPLQHGGTSMPVGGGSCTRPSTLCSFCGGVLGAGDASSSLYLHAPLPHSLLSMPALLQFLGVSPPVGAMASHAVVCQECQVLLHKGDEAYQCLLQVTASMRQRWPESSLAATTQGSKRVRPILPKVLLAQDTSVLCGLCRAVPGDWLIHTAKHHQLSPRWRSPRLLAALRACLVEELQWGSGRRGARRCPACPFTCPHPEEFMEHLQQHHRVAGDLGFLVHLDSDEGVRQGKAGQQQGDSEAAGWVKGQVEEVWEGGDKEQVGNEETREVKDKQEQKEETEQNRLLSTNEAAEDKGVLDSKEVVEGEGQQWEETMDECVLEHHAVEEQSEAEGDSVEGQRESGPDQNGCPKRPEGGGGRGRGGQWRCRVCAATFTSQQEHDLHKATTHPDSVRAGRGKTRPASASSLPQGDTAAAGDHQNTENQMAASQEGAIVIMEGDGCGGVTHRRLQPPQDTPSHPDGTADLECGTCGEVFRDRPALVRHRRAAHPGLGSAVCGGSEVLLECPLCGRRVLSLPALRLHQARMHGRPTQPLHHHRCRLCPMQCHTRALLEQHMQERHGAPPPPPPVRCGQCGKTYSARYIDVHMANMHGDAGRFPCTFCPMRFGGRGSLRAHVSMEHANTTWACQECPLQFSKYHQLRQHRLYMHSQAEHRCPECPRSFKRRCDLTEHAKRRHRERPPRECSFCPKVYSDRKRLRMHLMRKHGVAWEDTLAQGYARRQRENNCLRRRQQQQQQQQPCSPSLSLRQQQQQKKQQQQQQAAEGTEGEAVAVLDEEQREYSVVELTEAPHPLTNTISYIILEEA